MSALTRTPTEHSVDTWTAVHAPRVGYAKDCAPESSWWAEVASDDFYSRAREEYTQRISRSNRHVGQRGIDG